MAFMDEALHAIDEGLAAAQGAADDLAMERLDFMKGFIRLCDDGWKQGWHERNGGNLTYRMTEKDYEQARAHFAAEPGEWEKMDVAVPTLGGACFVSTGAGRYMRNIIEDPAANVGIVELNQTGDAWRVRWGFKNGGRVTSEFPSHLLNHAVRMEATDGACRVIYHAHPANVIAMTFVLPLESKVFSRALWKAMTECVVVFPQGVGVVPWMVPGGAEIAQATSELMKSFDAAIWASHGLFASGPDFDATFGLMHTIEKAAEIYVRARAMNGGSDQFRNTITDEGLRAIAKEFHISLNEDFLEKEA